jgi:hypothetical protein
MENINITRYTYDYGWGDVVPHPYGEYVGVWAAAQALRLAASMLYDADRFVDANELMRIVAQLEAKEDA